MATIKYVTGTVFGKEICEKLGLDPNKVHAISFHAAPDDIVKLTIEFYPDEGDILPTIRKYAFVEIDSDVQDAG